MVERRRLNRKNIMREFTISELSAVDRPAQAHARMVIMKRADDEDVNEKYTQAEANYRTADGAERCGDCEHFDGSSGCSLVAGAITASGLCDYFEEESTSGDEPMTEAEKKQLAELQKNVDALTKQLEAATDKDPAKKASDLQKALDESNAKIEALTKKIGDAKELVGKAKEEYDEAVAKAGMSDKEKEHMTGLSPEDRIKYMRMTPEERAKQTKKAADEAASDNPVVYKADDGQEYHKKDDPRMVALAKRADEETKTAKAEREKRETAELTKRADDTLKHFSGEAKDKVEVLRAISKMPDAARQELEKMLEAGGKAIAAAFDRIGHSSEEVAKSAKAFDKRVEDIVARDKCSRSDAMTKARQEDPAAYDAYQQAGTGAN